MLHRVSQVHHCSEITGGRLRESPFYHMSVRNHLAAPNIISSATEIAALMYHVLTVAGFLHVEFLSVPFRKSSPVRNSQLPALGAVSVPSSRAEKSASVGRWTACDGHERANSVQPFKTQLHSMVVL